MTHSSLAESADRLSEALDAFDWEAAETISGSVIEQLPVSTFAEVGVDAHRMLNDLRRKRRFAVLERLADALIVAGFRSAQIRCEYAQALIDQRRFAAAEYVLASFGHDGGLSEAERAEITGLVGRLWKQLYVNPGDRAKASEPVFLNRAIAAYTQEYERKPGERTWHGINASALIARAERDGLPTDPSYPSWRTLASDILRSLDARSRAGGRPLPAFDVATRVEALVALERWTDAEAAAAEYVRCPDADAFELGSTDRQLREVWGVTSTSPGAEVLSIIDAVLLRKQGGGVAFSGVRAEGEQQAVDAARSDPALEAVLGAERFQTLTWYRQGLECCSSIARIETRSGRGFGTGWLVGGGELNPAWASETLLITNKHVISPSVNGRPFVPAPSVEALRPEDAIVFLQVHGVRVEVDSVAWTSPDLELDATIVRLRNLPPGARPLPLASSPVLMRQPPARVYVIGHPAGRDLELSLHDNQMLACDERRLHYRAPTEGGSSGSPVFDEEGWRVVALHHAGGHGIQRLDRPGEAYDANEGIAIEAIRQGIVRSA